MIAATQAWREFAALAAPTLACWKRDLDQPEVVQARILHELLQNNRDCEFGRRYGFADIRDLHQYRERVPIQSWSDVQPWVARAECEHADVLSAQPPLFFERSSGSGANCKHIPYTAAFLAELQRALVVWLAGLQRALPGIAEGSQYWSMSPSTQALGRTPSGIAIGSANDLSYIAGSAVESLAPSLIVPGALDGDADWRAQTLLALVAAEDLAFISVWSPTFLTALLRPLFEQDPGVLRCLCAHLPTPRWRAVMAAIDRGECSALWPRLAAVSCWMDGPSRTFAESLRARFPGVHFSPKGLFATEGVVSISDGASATCPLAIQSHFLEFIGDDDSFCTVESLALGESYRVLLTTGGGLYRYALGDRVRVTGRLARSACVEFVGRDGECSDLVGEKLDESVVAAALAAVLGPDSGACLVACAEIDPPYYLALLVGDSGATEALSAALDAHLQSSFHYAHARQLGQLGSVRVSPAPDTAALSARLQQACEQAGLRAGDIKPRVLIQHPGIARALCKNACPPN